MVKPSLSEDASPEAFGEAMVRCLGYAPGCSEAKECEKGGFCFSSDGVGFQKAKKQIEALIKDEGNIYARSWLKIALDHIEDQRLVCDKTFEALRYSQIAKAIRRTYDAQRSAERKKKGPAPE